MKIVIALLMAAVILAFGLGTLRGLARPSVHLKPDQAMPPPKASRVSFWCETCGEELLLLRQGTEAPPRHCGEKMQRREEVARA